MEQVESVMNETVGVNEMCEFESVNFNVFLKIEEPFISEDIWKKFGIDNLDQYTESLENIDITPLPLLHDEEYTNVFDKGVGSQISKLDAMWGGNGVENSVIDDSSFLPPASTWIAPSLVKAPAVAIQQSVAPGRSLLIKPAARPPQTTTTTTPVQFPVIPSPDSPPISDDEDGNKPDVLMKFLNDTVGELDIDEDLYDYITSNGGDLMSDGEEEDNSSEQSESPVPPPIHNYAVNDHSYHKDKNASMRIANLGIDTPSDSEEEIDVVSVGEKNNNKMGHMLPTNPSIQYQEHLERRVQSAITQKTQQQQQQQRGRSVNNNTAGIKVLPPVRRCSTVHSQNKKQVPESRAVKRTKNCRSKITPSYQPYRRRTVHTVNGSDSEPELEKRSLHNNMERQRRIDLRNSFDDLRAMVPKLEGLERAPKVQILNESRDYCDYLTIDSERLEKEKMNLQQKQDELRGRLSFLRRKLAACYTLK